MNSLFSGAEVIHTVTRADFISDGDLVDVTATASEAGFRVPVAISRAAWERYVEWTDEDTRKQVPQDTDGRLWDVLNMALYGIRAQKPTGQRFVYPFHVVQRDGRSVEPAEAQLALVSGPGDHGEHVMTILLPEED